VPSFGPISRKDLIRYLRKAGFEGPFSGGKHQYMEKGDITLRVPNPHRGDIRKDLLDRLLKQAGISKDEWRDL
jgi:predicted RNA binding protein YcfA (HicA-like mRNA interferase family)